MSDTDGKIAWFEIGAENAERARSFYGGLLGWTFEGFEEDGGDYQVASNGGGAVYTDEAKGILVYFGTADIDASVARVRELGGEAGGAQDIPGIGRYAHCSDTEGNDFGLYQRG